MVYALPTSRAEGSHVGKREKTIDHNQLCSKFMNESEKPKRNDLIRQQGQRDRAILFGKQKGKPVKSTWTGESQLQGSDFSNPPVDKVRSRIKNSFLLGVGNKNCSCAFLCLLEFAVAVVKRHTEKQEGKGNDHGIS